MSKPSYEELLQRIENLENPNKYAINEEIKIGIFKKDGIEKALYRIVYLTNFLQSDNNLVKTIDISSLKIADLITLKGISNSNPIEEAYYAGSADYLRIYMSSINQVKVQIGSSYPQRPVEIKVILEYTKNE